MILKISVEGELLELLSKEAEENERSNTQQARFIIRQYYKNKVSEMTQGVSKEVQIVTDTATTQTIEVKEVKEETKEESIEAIELPSGIFDF